MKHSEQINEIGAALAKAQRVMKGAKKDRDRKSTRLNSSHSDRSRMPSSA